MNYLLDFIYVYTTYIFFFFAILSLRFLYSSNLQINKNEIKTNFYSTVVVVETGLCGKCSSSSDDSSSDEKSISAPENIYRRGGCET